MNHVASNPIKTQRNIDATFGLRYGVYHVAIRETASMNIASLEWDCDYGPTNDEYVIRLEAAIGCSLPEQSGTLKYYIPEPEKKAKG